MNQRQLSKQAIFKDLKRKLIANIEISNDLELLEIERRAKEIELDILAAEIKTLSQQLTDADKREHTDWWQANITFDDLSTDQKRKFIEHSQNFKNNNEVPVSAILDAPKNLQIILFNNNSIIVIDIIDSINKDLKNIGHPLIIEAIRRYKQIAYAPLPYARTGDRRYKPKKPNKQYTAERNLQKISEALVSKEKDTAGNKWFRLLLEDTNNQAILFLQYPDEYFEKLAELLKEPSIKRQTPTIRINTIKRRLREYSNLDPKEIESFIKERTENIEKFKRTTGKVLRNEFIAWKARIKKSSVKSYRTKLLRELENLQNIFPNQNPYSLISDSKIHSLVEDKVLEITHQIKLTDYKSIENLSIVETSSQNPSTSEPPVNS